MSGNDIQTKGKKVLDGVWAYSLGNTARTIRHSDISVKQEAGRMSNMDFGQGDS